MHSPGASSKRKTHPLYLAGICLIYLFFYIPIFVLLVFSFNSERFPAPWNTFTWAWYEELFTTEALWDSFWNSLFIALSATAISILGGILFLFHVAASPKAHRYLALFYGNLLVPETMLAVALLGFFTWIAVPLGIGTLIVAHTVLSLGFVIPILYVRYKDLDPRLFEASLVLGASELQTFLKITLPLLGPALFSTALLVFILSFDDFILSYFCAGTNAQTLSLYILSMLRSGVSPIVNALSALLIAFSSLLVLVFFYFRTRSKII